MKEHYLNNLLDYLQLNAKKFSESLKFDRVDRVYNVLNFKNGLSNSLAKIITDNYPFVNYDWLLTGKGEMLNSERPLTISASNSNILALNNQTSGVPYYENVDIAASIQGMYNDYSKYPPTFFINYPHFNDCSAYLPVVGDSMYPKYASGEIIAVKQIFNLDMIQWGEAYMIVGNHNTDDLRTIKLVHPHSDDESKIILRASNPNFKGDTPICKVDILEIYIVKGKITRSQL